MREDMQKGFDRIYDFISKDEQNDPRKSKAQRNSLPEELNIPRPSIRKRRISKLHAALLAGSRNRPQVDLDINT